MKLSRYYLLSRGTCCGNGCSNCPYLDTDMDELTWESRIQAKLEILPKELREPVYEFVYKLNKDEGNYQKLFDQITELSEMLVGPLKKYQRRMKE